MNELHFADFDFARNNDNNCDTDHDKLINNDEQYYHNHHGNARQYAELDEDETVRDSFEEYRKSYEYYDHRKEQRYWDWNNEEQDQEDEESVRIFKPQEPNITFVEKYPSLYDWWYRQLWYVSIFLMLTSTNRIVSFSALAPGISYWAPNLWWPDPSRPLECINFNLVLLNATGAALIAFATEMNAVKYQYPQNYFM